MIRISYETFSLLCDLGDREARDIRETEWDMEWQASKYAEPRLEFHYFSRSGEIRMEARSRYPY